MEGLDKEESWRERERERERERFARGGVQKRRTT
jgi:hypothetical protein